MPEPHGAQWPMEYGRPPPDLGGALGTSDWSRGPAWPPPVSGGPRKDDNLTYLLSGPECGALSEDGEIERKLRPKFSVSLGMPKAKPGICQPQAPRLISGRRLHIQSGQRCLVILGTLIPRMRTPFPPTEPLDASSRYSVYGS